jgi:hypothetical protein
LAWRLFWLLILSTLLLSGRLRGSGSKTAGRIWKILCHHIVVRHNQFSVERNLAGYAMTFVEVICG